MINNFEVYNKYLDYDSSNLNKLLEKQKLEEENSVQAN